MQRTMQVLVLFMLSAAMLAGCGGSGGSALFAPSGSTATITGSVYASPVAGGSLVVLNSAGTNTIAGPVTSGIDGTYRIEIPSSALTSDLIFSSTSGTFTDEATGYATPAGTLRAYIAGGSLTSGTQVNLDRSSAIIADLMSAGAGTTLAGARSLFAAAFGFTPDTSVAPRNGPSLGQDAPQRLAALRAGAFSQLTKDLKLGPEWQFPLLRALALDLADDGTLNGSVGPVNGTNLGADIMNRFERSMVSFLTDTTHNLTGLTTAEIGSLPFGKVALTNSYRVEYVPGTIAAKQGRTTFDIKVTTLSDGNPAPGLTLALMPMMHMPTMQHATPVGSIIDNGDGTYACAVYYLMASGPGSGYWELKVKIGGMMGETAVFYPQVRSDMTARATLKGQADLISNMTGTEKRSYYLFNDGLVSGATTTLKLFLAAKESMMSYPAVSDGTLLHTDTGALMTVTGPTLQASTDLSNWSAGVDNGSGQWTLEGLTGLASGVTGTVYLKLNVNSEEKTTDGNAASGPNGYATLIVTP